jgi:ubiquinone/menaquinone biosynthesis C-methylase UbiE
MKYIDIVNEIDEYHNKNKIISEGTIYKDIFTKINNYYPLELQINRLSFSTKNQKFISDINKKQIPIIKQILLKNQIYPNNKSNYQIQYIIEQYKNNNNIEIFIELIRLLSYRLEIKKLSQFIDLLLEKERTDIEYYKLMKNYKIKNEVRYITRSDEIYYFLSLYNDKKIEKYLDYGCGNGKKTAELSKLLNLKIDNTFCADIDSWSKYNKKKNSNTTFIEIIPNKQFQLPDNSIDLLTTTHVLHHIDRLDFVLKELNRILKKDHYLVITEHDTLTINEHILVDIEHAFFERVIYNNFNELQYIKCMNYMEIDIMLLKYGFELIDYKFYVEDDIRDKKLPSRSYILLFQKIYDNNQLPIDVEKLFNYTQIYNNKIVARRPIFKKKI